MKKFILVVGLVLVILSFPAWLLWRSHSSRRDVERLRMELMDLEVADLDRVWPRPRLLGEPVEGTARAAYGLALGALDGTPDGQRRAVEFVSRGTRTDRVGSFPTMPGPAMLQLGKVLEGACRAAEEAAQLELAVTRSLECIQFGTDLTRGNWGMERYYGVRIARRGAEALDRCVPPAALTEDQRIWIREWLRGPRTGGEVVSGVRLTWLSSYWSLLSGAPDTAWVRTGKGPLTSAGVPDEINPESLSDREIIDAWRRLERTLSRIESVIPSGERAGTEMARIFSEARTGAGPFEKDAYLHIERRLLVERGVEEATRTILLELLGKGE